jgi:hypothetical protein
MIPSDTPDSFIYSPKKYKGLGLIKASWEAFIQNINACNILISSNNNFVNSSRNLEEEMKFCLKKLKIEEDQIQNMNSRVKSRKMRDILREREFDKWSLLPSKGRGISLFKEEPAYNKWFANKSGLSDSELKSAIKLISCVAPVRAMPGRSRDGPICRFCDGVETQNHVIGFCPHGALLRDSRHNHIRSLIAEALEKSGLKVHQEVHCIMSSGSTGRIDIIAINEKKKLGYIIDPTVRMENVSSQPEDVHKEKVKIYTPSIDFFKEKYNLKSIEIIGLFVGSRGTISNFLENFRIRFHLNKSLLSEVAIKAIKSSTQILHHHLYTTNNSS